MADKKKEDETMLVPLNSYLSTGIHIGMRQRVKPMEKYIYKVRHDKLAVFDIQKVDRKIRTVAKFLAQYDPKDILVVSRKITGHKPVVMLAKAIGDANAIYGRFMPGTLTNPNYEKFIEPKVVVVTDPFADKQAVEEATRANVPVVAACDTYNNPANIDLVVPLNNKGKKALALYYWILAREILKERKEIKGDAEFKYALEDFEMPAESRPRTEPKDERKKRWNKRY